jgi:hypothetical protein
MSCFGLRAHACTTRLICLCFQAFAHTWQRTAARNFFLFNSLRTLWKRTGVAAPPRTNSLVFIALIIGLLIPVCPANARPVPQQPVAQQDDTRGELQIVTSSETEKDSGVWVDSEYIGYLRDFWGNKKILLDPGEHEITIRKFGYKPFTQKVRIDTGQIA